MAIYELPNATDGIDSILVQITDLVPGLPVMIMVFTYFFVVLLGMGMQSRSRGYADFPLWSTLAMMSVFMLNLIFSLASGIINPIVISVTVALTLLSALLLFLTRGRFD